MDNDAERAHPSVSRLANEEVALSEMYLHFPKRFCIRTLPLRRSTLLTCYYISYGQCTSLRAQGNAVLPILVRWRSLTYTGRPGIVITATRA